MDNCKMGHRFDLARILNYLQRQDTVVLFVDCLSLIVLAMLVYIVLFHLSG